MLLHRHRVLREQAEAARRIQAEALQAEHVRRSDELERCESLETPAPAATPVADVDASAEVLSGLDLRGFVTAEEQAAMRAATVAEIRALGEQELRALAAKLGIEVDGRWGVGRIRREVAQELGHEI